MVASSLNEVGLLLTESGLLALTSGQLSMDYPDHQHQIPLWPPHSRLLTQEARIQVSLDRPLYRYLSRRGP